MPITVNEGGTLYELSEVYANESGTLYELDTVHSNESGTLYEIHSAWKPPDTLTWKSLTGGTATISSSNNGYNCTISGRAGISNSEQFDFTLKKPTRFTVTLDNWTGMGQGIDNPIILQFYSLDEGDTMSVSPSSNSFSIDVTESGSHYIHITTTGEPVTFTITAEKI